MGESGCDLWGRCRAVMYALAAVVAAAVPGPASGSGETTNMFGTVKAQVYEGKIAVESPSAWVRTEWRIEWPVSVKGADAAALAVIRRSMIDDCFGPLVGYSDRTASQRFQTPDPAVMHVFSRAYGKLDAGEGEDDALSLHAFDFVVDLRIRFAGAGYIGYVLHGYENEGGNGCHAYVTARVLSLATGAPVNEADIMTVSGANAFPKTFFDVITHRKGVRDYVIGIEDDVEAALGNFVIEPEGVRWWLPPYSLFAGCAGVQDLLMTWQELRPFLKPGKERELRAVFGKMQG